MENKEPILSTGQKSMLIAGVIAILFVALVFAAVYFLTEQNITIIVEQPTPTAYPTSSPTSSVAPVESPKTPLSDMPYTPTPVPVELLRTQYDALDDIMPRKKEISVEEQVWDLLKGYGLSDYAVAGIMGNIDAESRFNPAAKGDGGWSWGLCQWNSQRRLNMVEWVGDDWETNIEGQIDFLWWEMESGKGFTNGVYDFERLVNAKSIRSATQIFMCDFERPANQSEEKINARTALSKKYYDMFAEVD